MDDILGKIKRKLLRKYPAFGSITANLEFVIDDRMYSNGQPTCGTDGKRVAFHSEYVKNASEAKLLYAGAHEIGHVALDHIYRSEGKNHELWNIACDAVLNQLLKQDDIEIPKNSIDREDAKGYNVEDYYQKLLNEQQDKEQNQKSEQNKSANQSNSNSESNSQEKNENQSSNGEQSENSESTGSSNEEQEKSADVGHDTHSMWDDAIKERKEQEKQKNTSEEVNDKKQESNKKPIDEQKAFANNVEERKKQLDELMKKLSKDASSPATTTNSDLINLDKIGTAKPLIDWRYLLKETLQLDVEWSYQNAEIEHGVITPQLEAYPQPETEILLDTSGSISHTLLKNFLKECKNIMQASRVKVGCFDTEFYGWHEVRTMEDIDELQYNGGGGTNFNIAVNAFTKRVENKIVFTDGEAKMPNTSVDAIWIIFGDQKINPPGGRVIYISAEQLQQLYYEEDYKMGRSR